MKTIRYQILRSGAAATLFCMSGAGLGAGFYLPELGSPASLGTGGVANVTNNVGADASITNPAGMTGIAERRVLTGLQFFVPSIEFDAKRVESRGERFGFAPATGSDGGNAGIVTPVPSLFYVTPVSHRIRFGFSVTGPLGGGVDYGNQFVGRYAVQNAVLGALALTPSVSYAVTDKLSIGAGVSVLYTFFDQKIAVRQPFGAGDATVKFNDLDGWGAQAIIGVQYEFTDRLMLGVVYRSKADTDLEGDVKTENWRLPFQLANKVKISWTNPQWLEAGIRYRLNEKATVALNLGWQAWSEFSENELAIGDKVNVLDRNWDNTWHTGAAFAYDLSDRSHFSVGFTYDSSPVKDEFRTFDFPVDEMWKLSAAYGWSHGENLRFALGATLYFVGAAAIDQTAQGVRVVGDYSSNKIAVVGGSLNFTF
jgi:long-chain fatty acid transport protein